jgi:rRNA biogenesis protein RRP5
MLVQNLSVGAKLWGAVQEVSHKRLVIALPHGLRGFVALEDASDVLRSLLTTNPSKGDKRLRALLRNAVPSLTDLYYPGQLVRTAVCKLEADSRTSDNAAADSKVSRLLHHIH